MKNDTAATQLTVATVLTHIKIGAQLRHIVILVVLPLSKTQASGLPTQLKKEAMQMLPTMQIILS